MVLFILDVILGFVSSSLLPLLQIYSSTQEYLRSFSLLLVVPCLAVSLLCLMRRPFLYVDPNKEQSLLLLNHTSGSSHLYASNGLNYAVQEAEAVNKVVIGHSCICDCNGKKADWLETPDDVLSCVADRLVDVGDIIRFGAVCASWRPIYIEKRTSRQLAATPQQIPMLLSADFNDNRNTRSLYSITEKRVLDFQVCVPHNLYCLGSSRGWLVTVSKDFKICLLNPLMAVNNEIVLPPLTSFYTADSNRNLAKPYTWGFYAFLQKVVLSANPASNPNFIALAIYGTVSGLAYFKLGMKAWTILPFKYRVILDIVYYENKFYAVSGNGPVYILDFNGMYPKMSELVVPMVESLALKRYLVESSGDLLQVLRYTDWDDMDEDDMDGDDMENYFNVGFDVFKLDRIGNNWNKVATLNGHALFLGLSTSLSVLASDFPGCKPNSIYYTDDYTEAWNWKATECAEHLLHDIGMFNIEDGTIEQHYPTESKKRSPAPIWIEPTL